jgi:hypothetical protein
MKSPWALRLILVSTGLAIIEASSHVSLGYYEPPFSYIVSSRLFYIVGMSMILISPFLDQGVLRAISMAMLGGAIEDLLYWLLVWHLPHQWAPYYPVILHIPLAPIFLSAIALFIFALFRRRSSS